VAPVPVNTMPRARPDDVSGAGPWSGAWTMRRTPRTRSASGFPTAPTGAVTTVSYAHLRASVTNYGYADNITATRDCHPLAGKWGRGAERRRLAPGRVANENG
jgi:hypothetical protein